MSDYSYVIDNMVFSFSSVSSFETCAYGFKLSYIDAEERLNNFFSDYGTLIHRVLEKYFKGDLEREWLKDYFTDNWEKVITSDLPPYADKYYNDALEFFDFYDLPDLEKYEVISIEDKADVEYEGINLVVKPDLVIRNKETGKTILYDFKTSKPVKGKKWDLDKISGYENQLLLYAYFLEKVKGIHIDEIQLLFIRLGEVYNVQYTADRVEKVLNWFTGVVQKIKWEEDFVPTVNQWFCSQICSVRRSCTYWGG